MKKSILEAFQIIDEGVPLTGGQDTSLRYGDIVLKPVDDPGYYAYNAEIFNQLASEHYRISKHIKSINDRYVEEGYGATKYEPGYDEDLFIKEKLEVADMFLKDLSIIDIKDFPLSDDPWSKANQVLWFERTFPEDWDKDKLDFMMALNNAFEPYTDPYQMIHGDLGGNILFHETLKPLVIDFSPAIAPAKYAKAIIVCDSIAWAGTSIDTLNLLQPIQVYKPYIQRAIAFRLFTLGFVDDCSFDYIKEEWIRFKPIWDYINQLK